MLSGSEWAACDYRHFSEMSEPDFLATGKRACGRKEKSFEKLLGSASEFTQTPNIRPVPFSVPKRKGVER